MEGFGGTVRGRAARWGAGSVSDLLFFAPKIALLPAVVYLSL